MPNKTIELGAVVARLKRHYGTPERPPIREAFEWILWENVAYLASPARRQEAFDALKDSVGTSPHKLLEASKRDLMRVTGRGILGSKFAGKLRECARIAVADFDGEIDRAIGGSLELAKRVLQAFPGIGEPGAERILLFTSRHALLAPDSNGLRVLVRLGLVREEKSYARTYAASRSVAEELGAKPTAVQQAHMLLEQHGRTLCKRTAPRCLECPLERDCSYARSVAQP